MRIKSFPKPSYLLNSTNRVVVDPASDAVGAAATPRADDDDDEGRNDSLMIRSTPILLPDVVGVVQARVRQLKEERIGKKIVNLIIVDMGCNWNRNGAGRSGWGWKY
jgi:hypothetical protein